MELVWKRRFKFERKVREHFWNEGFEETRTPLLVKSPGMEPHILPIQLKSKNHPVFLPTSPEFAMKKLLARGMTKIFQICPAFRDEPESPDHHPEFTMLEVYESGTTLEKFQTRVESLFQNIARELNGTLSVHFRNERVDFSGPWQRSRIVDLFQEFLEIDLRTHQDSPSLATVCEREGLHAEPDESWDDLYFKLWLNRIEPNLPKNRPIFVTHYPTSQSSLCNTVKDECGFSWANRFEVYVGNLELGNAFDELRDAKKQRKNFEHDQKIRRDIYGDRYPTSPIDEDLLTAIGKMPPTCGIALGLDRMAMLILEAATIQDVIPLKSYWE